MNRGLHPSGIRRIFERALELERGGRRIVHLEIGRPHFGSPEAATRAAVAALRAGAVHYTPNRGLPELCELIAARRERGSEEVVVTAGGSEAVAAAILAILRPGEEAIILDPAWPHYQGQLRLAGCIPVHVPCACEDGFQPDPERVAAAITRRTRMLILSSPSNPSGAVIDPARLSALAELCLAHDLIALSDEIYAGFLYDGARHRSIAAEPDMAGRTVIVDSCSKTWSMTGWRVGWALAPKPLAQALNVVHQHLSVCAPAFAQAGAIAALEQGAEHAGMMLAEYDERRRTLLGGLAGLEAVCLHPPAGAFYAFPRVDAPEGLTGEQVAMRLLEDAGVATVPGSVFGEGFAAHIRLCYAVSSAELDEGLDRMRSLLG
jgi:aspartate/methionine/tyrosine aminotransferase